MRRLGLLLIVVGLIWGIVAFNMSTSVDDVLGGSVYNIGLMDERRIQLLISAVIIICGVVLFGFGTVAESRKTIAVSSESPSELEKPLENDQKKCPSSAESIKLEALKCRYCGEVFDPSDVEKLFEERKGFIEEQPQVEERKDKFEELKLNKEYELIEGKSGGAFCVACGKVSPKNGMFYNKISKRYYHKSCL